ncbi:MAG TPA: hypothetical protein VMZ24_05990 [Patescibacteria group bacterium]|nr:hypothetical protein [Patescibacteria group bacterium]
MRNNALLGRSQGSPLRNLSAKVGSNPRAMRQLVIGVILILALFAFEMFNFDTTRFALQSLLGDIRFFGFAWATILAVAFCAIDFAGLARLFTPESGRDEPKEIWYLTGAWLLGATMNAVMTWWAVSTVLIDHPVGNEVLSREQLLTIVPVFVAVLVWLTRILFIGAIAMAGEKLLHKDEGMRGERPPASLPATRSDNPAQPKFAQSNSNSAGQTRSTIDLAAPPPLVQQQPTRVNRRPPRPVANGGLDKNYGGAQVSGRHRR